MFWALSGAYKVFVPQVSGNQVFKIFSEWVLV